MQKKKKKNLLLIKSQFGQCMTSASFTCVVSHDFVNIYGSKWQKYLITCLSNKIYATDLMVLYKYKKGS